MRSFVAEHDVSRPVVNFWQVLRQSFDLLWIVFDNKNSFVDNRCRIYRFPQGRVAQQASVPRVYSLFNLDPRKAVQGIARSAKKVLGRYLLACAVKCQRFRC